MVEGVKEQTHVARPSGLRAALQNAAQLPFTVAAGLADEVAYQTEGMYPGRTDGNADSKQLYHESNNSDMRQGDFSQAQRELHSRSDTQHQKPDMTFSHSVAHQSAAPPAASVITTEGPASEMMRAADRISQHSDVPLRVRYGPKKSVSIKNTVDVIGESNADHMPAENHLVPAKGTGSDNGNSTSSSVSFPLLLRCLVTLKLLQREPNKGGSRT